MIISNIIIGSIIVIVFFIFYNLNQSYRLKKFKKVKETWGKEKDEFFQFDRIEQYNKLVNNKDFHTISNQTQIDIDFQDLFVYLDRTTSKVGQQFLYSQLLNPTNNINKLKEFSNQVEYFNKNSKDRDTIQMKLFILSQGSSYSISNLFGDNIFQKPKWYNWVKLDLTITILLLLFSIKFHFLLIWLMIPLFLNFVLHFWYKNRSINIVKTLPQLNLLINVSKFLKSKEFIKYEGDVSQSITELKKFQSKLKYLNTGRLNTSVNVGSMNLGGDVGDLLYYFIDFVKGFFLVDFFIFFSSIDDVLSKRKSVENLFHFVGWVDSSISVSYIREGDLITSEPEFINSVKNIEFVDIKHPLIDKCVGNNLKIDGKSILITGSNMSGKSTFLRTILINQLLSQTIFTTFTRSFKSSFLRIHSSIRIDDSLLDGKSYYFEEVNIVFNLLKQVETNDNLFILDEVFKGTNTIERISSSKSILSFLNKSQNIVIVSTHDIELTTLLKNEFDLYHFSEDINDDKLHFDHELKEGELTTRNGIKLLEISNYPKEIIDESLSISKTLRRYN
ncbi:MAG: DNA mismatch repair protein MutS [Bacteroidota bacterium]|nr:DNA mismatch repair protein MutS [Bacteroidota bacterium]